MAEKLQDIVALALDCLCETVAVRDNPPALCCVRYGTEVPQDVIPVDVCCEGLAWVRVGDSFPSSQSFPDPDSPGQGCVGEHWAYEIELGLFRCANATDCDSWTTETTQHLIDRQSLVLASCCFGKRFAKTYHGSLSWFPQAGTVLPTDGGCSGSTLMMLVQVPGVCCL